MTIDGRRRPPARRAAIKKSKPKTNPKPSTHQTSICSGGARPHRLQTPPTTLATTQRPNSIDHGPFVAAIHVSEIE